MVNALIETAQVEILSGTTIGVPVPTDSGRSHVIHRCPACQTAIWSHYGGRDALSFVRVGALDDPAVAPPDVHIYTRSKLPWVALPEGVPAFDEYYESRQHWPPESLARRKAALST